MKTRSFKSGNSIAIRVPKHFGLKVGDLSIQKMGDIFIVQQPQHSWKEMFAKLKGGVSDDFMKERNQPPLDEREAL